MVTKSFQDEGHTRTYRQFQPKQGDEAGDLWATTPADPDLTIDYVDGTGQPASRKCPTGCLLFYPGAATTHRPPQLVGTGAWSTAITAIF
ncbi:hypothetical protein [Streptomyces sp. NPDC097619]|uniref:hypothetical protein n=1 Tax=Streptomyces sp. NPDC097619 TaxID=3157228 RepID=UPI00332189EC